MYEVLADGQWHCGKHELPGTQPAKAVQIMRQHGFAIENLTAPCDISDESTVHRRLLSTTPMASSFVRMPIPHHLRLRVLAHYGNREAITLQQLDPGRLEVDHRFPQVRWSRDEVFDPEMPVAELHAKFQLLTRANNLWKSRHCEHCRATGERGTFVGIRFFASGGPEWDPNQTLSGPSGSLAEGWSPHQH